MLKIQKFKTICLKNLNFDIVSNFDIRIPDLLFEYTIFFVKILQKIYLLKLKSVIQYKSLKIISLFMNKIVVFIILVVLGILGIIIALNQPSKSSREDKKNDLTKFSNPTTNPSQTTSTTPSLSPNSSASNSEITANKATITTSKGDIVFSFYTKDAPRTVENFTRKAKSGFYNNLTFHRVEDWVIQGGDPLGNGRGGGKMPTELNNKPFVTGSVGIARGSNINSSNDAQFFITKTEAAWLNKEYTNFGIVINGMDVVNKIQIDDKILEITVE